MRQVRVIIHFESGVVMVLVQESCEANVLQSSRIRQQENQMHSDGVGG